VGLLLWAGAAGFNALVKTKLIRVATEAAGPGYTVKIGRVHANLFQGDLRLNDVALQIDTAMVDSLLQGDRTGLVAIDAAHISIRSLSYSRLIFQGDLHVALIEVEAPAIRHYFRPSRKDSVQLVEEAPADLPALISADSVVIKGANGNSSDVTGVRASLNVGEVDIRLGGIRVVTNVGPVPRFSIRSGVVDARTLKLALPPLYDLHIGTAVLRHPEGSALLVGTRMMPRENEQNYHTVLEFETDLFRVAVDTLLMRGADVGRLLADAAVHVGYIELVSPELQVYRDKSMADAPWAKKDLPGSALRALPWSIRVDTVALVDARISYHERLDRGADFGTLEFTDVNGRIQGLNNSAAYAEAGGKLRASATAKVYESGSIKLDYIAPMGSMNDAFTLNATMNGMPFSLFNQMTDSLLQVTASEGRLLSMDLRMAGNDRSGSGTVDLEYKDLHIEIRSQGDSGLKTKLIDMAANALIRRDNLRTQGKYRQGVFDIDRRLDRAIFNFWWNALKAGCIDTMVPGMLRERMRKGKKSNKVKG
jgi:hypothetical protein